MHQITEHAKLCTLHASIHCFFTESEVELARLARAPVYFTKTWSEELWNLKNNKIYFFILFCKMATKALL